MIGNYRVIGLVFLLAAFTTACGQEQSGSENGGQFRGALSSYETAQEEIEEEGGEQEVGEYRIGYIVESAEGSGGKEIHDLLHGADPLQGRLTT